MEALGCDGLDSQAETTWLMSSAFSITPFPLCLMAPTEHGGSKRGQKLRQLKAQ